MNPLTLVKRTQKITSTEAALGISEEASWHSGYKDSAYIFVGGIPYELTEGDLLAVFAQYGEIVDVNLVRDKATGKSKGFAFLAYEDQRSTILAVDNLNGAKVLGRIVRVDHVSNYKRKEEEEDEEAEQQKREARGICRAFQRGECTRGASCKFSHHEQRAADTGWGPQDESRSRWDHDKYEGSPKSHRESSQLVSKLEEKGSKHIAADGGRQRSRRNDDHGDRSYSKDKDKDKDRREFDKRSEEYEKENRDRRAGGTGSERQQGETDKRQKRERQSLLYGSKPYNREDEDRQGSGYRSRYEEDKIRSDRRDKDYDRRRGEKRSRRETDE